MADKAIAGPAHPVIPTPGDGNPMGTQAHPLYVSLASAQMREVGPYYVTTAAGQTAAGLKLGDTAGQGFVCPRAGFVTGFSAMVDAAVTGAAQSFTLKVYKNGSLLNAAFNLAFTQAGAETKKNVTVDPTLYAVAAGDIITVVYDSNTITNTPKVVAFVEVQM